MLAMKLRSNWMLNQTNGGGKMKNLIEEILSFLKKNFNLEPQLTVEQEKELEQLIIDSIKSEGYGYCQDCDERRGEPIRNEGWD